MKEGKPSRTAIAAASMRAAHVLLDDEPKILRDDLALALSGVGDEAALRTTMDRIHTKVGQQTTPEFAQSFLRHARGLAVWRSRYVEDELEQAMQRGVTQYVILGAGSILLPTADTMSLRSCVCLKSIIPPRNTGNGHACTPWA